MIFLVGHHGAGKTETAGILRDDLHCLHFETSSIVKHSHSLQAPHLSLPEWEASMCQTKGPDAINQCILHSIKAALLEYTISQQMFQDIVITGNRQIESINYLYNELIHSGLLPHSEKIIVGLSVDDDTLHARYVARGRSAEDHNMTKEVFQLLLREEDARGLASLMRQAIILDNSLKNLDTLRSDVVRFFLSTLGYEYRSPRVA